MGAARECHRGGQFLAGGLLALEGLLQRGCVLLDVEVLVFVGDRDRLPVLVEVEQRVHRQGLAVLHHLAGRIEMRLRTQDVAAVDAVVLEAERHVVARRAPARLLGDVHVGQAVLGEEPFFLGNDQWRGVGERDVAEARALDLGAGPLREGAGGQGGLRCGKQGGCARQVEEVATAWSRQPGCDRLVPGLEALRHRSPLGLLKSRLPDPTPNAKNAARKTPWQAYSTATLLYRPDRGWRGQRWPASHQSLQGSCQPPCASPSLELQ